MDNSTEYQLVYEPDYANGSNITSVSERAEILGPQYHRTARVVIIVTMIFCSVVGNSLVVSRIMCQRGRLTKPKVLFLNLALADLGVTLVTMTSQLVWELMGRLWIAGDVFCRIFKLLQTFALVSSTYMLVAIALDRYYAIVRPLRPSPRPWRLAQGAWLASLLPSLPNLYVFHEWEAMGGKKYCSSIFYTGGHPPSYRQIYMAYVFLSIFIVPFSLLVSLYARILVCIWKQSSAIDHRSASSLPKAKVKTLKLAVVIFTAFMITNLPYVVQEIILAFGRSDILNMNVVALCGVISASNSALNPYIFLAFQSKVGFAARWRALVKSVRSSSSNISRMGERLSLTLRTSRSLQTGRTSITSASTIRSPRLDGGHIREVKKT